MIGRRGAHRKSWSVVALACLLLFLNQAYGQDAPLFSPEEDYHMTASVDNLSPFVGQQVRYTLRFYAASVPNFNLREPGFVGFWRGEQSTGRTIENIGGRQYSVTSTTILLYPTRSGRQEIEPAILTIPETVFSDKVMLTTPEFVFNIRALPDDPPEGFNGAVGRFSLDASVDQLTITVGAPVTLRYRITGSGNFEQMPPPGLNLPEGWRAYRNTAGGDIRSVAGGVLSEVSYEWQLIPNKSGTSDFPPFELVFFDPVEEIYQTSSTPALRVDVLPSGEVREIPDLSKIGNTSATLPLKTGVNNVAVSESGMPAVWFWIVWMIPPLSALSVWGGIRWRKWQHEQMLLRRRANALERARKRLQAALDAGNGDVRVYPLVYDAICVYLSDKFITTVNDLPSAEALLTEQGIDEALRRDVLSVMQAAQDGRYAPRGVVNAGALLRRAAEVLTRLDDVVGTVVS